MLSAIKLHGPFSWNGCTCANLSTLTSCEISTRIVSIRTRTIVLRSLNSRIYNTFVSEPNVATTRNTKNHLWLQQISALPKFVSSPSRWTFKWPRIDSISFNGSSHSTRGNSTETTWCTFKSKTRWSRSKNGRVQWRWRDRGVTSWSRPLCPGNQCSSKKWDGRVCRKITRPWVRCEGPETQRRSRGGLRMAPMNRDRGRMLLHTRRMQSWKVSSIIKLRMIVDNNRRLQGRAPLKIRWHHSIYWWEKSPRKVACNIRWLRLTFKITPLKGHNNRIRKTRKATRQVPASKPFVYSKMMKRRKKYRFQTTTMTSMRVKTPRETPQIMKLRWDSTKIQYNNRCNNTRMESL